MKLPFPRYLNFLLQFCPEVQGELQTRAKLAAIGLGAGKSFDLDKLSEADKAEQALSVKQAYDEIVKKRENLGTKINEWNVSASFGDRAFYHGDCCFVPQPRWPESTVTPPSRRCIPRRRMR
jgi:hypothetical protein